MCCIKNFRHENSLCSSVATRSVDTGMRVPNRTVRG